MSKKDCITQNNGNIKYTEAFYDYVQHFNSIYRKGLMNAPIDNIGLINEKNSIDNASISISTALYDTFFSFKKVVKHYGE